MLGGELLRIHLTWRCSPVTKKVSPTQIIEEFFLESMGRPARRTFPFFVRLLSLRVELFLLHPLNRRRNTQLLDIPYADYYFSVNCTCKRSYYLKTFLQPEKFSNPLVHSCRSSRIKYCRPEIQDVS